MIDITKKESKRLLPVIEDEQGKTVGMINLSTAELLVSVGWESGSYAELYYTPQGNYVLIENGIFATLQSRRDAAIFCYENGKTNKELLKELIEI